MVVSYFLMKNPKAELTFVSASSKLKFNIKTENIKHNISGQNDKAP